MNANFAYRWSAVALAASAGLALAVQPATQPANRPVNQPATRTAQPVNTPRHVVQSLDFCKLGTINGANIANPSGDVVGEISDLIISRGSGRVEYAIISSGEILGLGGKTIALPYNALRWDATNERFMSDLTEAQIEQAASFSPEDWSNLEHTTWTEGLEDWWDDTFSDGVDGDDLDDDMDDADDDDYDDAYDAAVEAAAAEAGWSPTVIDGTVVRVLRDDNDDDQVILVEVRRNDAAGAGATERVVLGPSWYVMGRPAVPMRGDPIQIKAVPYQGENQTRWIAVSGTIDGEEVTFRDAEGLAEWRDGDDRRSSGETVTASNRAGRLMFASKLVGAEARASDEDGGEVQNVIVERMSGHIAFIGFDPNENVLGLADEIILVPWDLVSVNAEHKVRIDATRDMLLASEPIPDDLGVLTTAPMPGAIYNAYGVEQPVYRPRWNVQRTTGAAPTNAAPTTRAGDPWASEGAITRAFRSGPEASVTGRIVQVTKVALVPGAGEATILHLETTEGAKQVVVGPSAHIDGLGVTFRPEQSVTVRGTNASINNKPYMGARTIIVDGRTIELWNQDRTAWIPD